MIRLKVFTRVLDFMAISVREPLESGRSGDVYITADNLIVKNGFFINTAALSTGDAGNITVRANSLNLLDQGNISSNGLILGRVVLLMLSPLMC